MKKLVSTLVICLFAVSSAFAQYKIEANTFSMEVLFSPVTVSTDAISLPAYGLKGRYFLNENWNVRLQLGFENDATKDVQFYNEDKDKVITAQNSTSFTLFPGVEYHFAGNDRLSPYVGAELGFGVYGNHEKITTTENDDYSKSNQTDYLLGVNLVSGVDIYVYQGLYLGVEVSLGMNNYRQNSAHTETQIGTTNVKDTPKDYTNDNIVGFGCVPSLRLGWAF